MDAAAIEQLEHLIGEARNLANDADPRSRVGQRLHPAMAAAVEELAGWLTAFADRHEDVLRRAGHVPLGDLLAAQGIPEHPDDITPQHWALMAELTRPKQV